MSTRTRRHALGGVAAVAALALAGGIAAQFTTSTTSAPQNIGTGTVALSIDSVSPMVWTQPIANLAAGDTVERFLDLRNSGTLKLSDLTLSQTNTLGTLLSAPSDISIELTACSVAWNATDGTCAGNTFEVLGSSSVNAWGAGVKDLKTFEDFGAGDVRHLKLSTTLSKDATNVVQNTSGEIVYTFGGTQRAAGTADSTGNISSASTILGQPASFSAGAPTAGSGSTASSVISFSDPTNGAATYSLSWGEVGNSAVAPQTATLPKGATSYELTGLSAGKTYSVDLVATLGVQKSTSTTTVSTSPAAPTTLSTTSISATGATVRWVDNTAGKATYQLTYTPAGGTAQTVNLPAGATSYTLSGLTSSKVYSLSLKAVVSGLSSTALTGSFTTAAPPLSSSVNGGLQVPVGTTVYSAQGDYYNSPTYAAKNAIDNNKNTGWESAAFDTSSFVVTFPTPTYVSGVYLGIGNSWKVQVLGDGAQVANTIVSYGTSAAFVPVTPGTYKTIQINFSKYINGGRPSLDELSIRQ